MTGIQVFRGQVVRQAVAHDVVSPAYDALTVPQRQAFRSAHPDSYLHVTRSAEDEPDGDTVDNATLVARGRESLERLLRQDVFTNHGDPAFFVYRLAQDGHDQYGLVCEIPSDYYHSVAKPHEATRDERAALLAEHFATVLAASSPIACAVRDSGALLGALTTAAGGTPVLDMTGDDGLQQTVWRVDDETIADELRLVLADQPLFIIDGHHRSAANKFLHDRGTSLPILATIFPEQTLQLVGFHRLLKLPAGMASADLVRRIGRRFRVEQRATVDAVEPGQVALVADGVWYVIHFDERPVAGGAGIRLGSLDPVVLEREILLGIVQQAGPFTVSYMPDTEPFVDIVDDAARQGVIPIFVAPVDIADMMAVAEGNVIMPAKSTYFTPKVRSGVFLRRFDEP